MLGRQSRGVVLGGLNALGWTATESTEAKMAKSSRYRSKHPDQDGRIHYTQEEDVWRDLRTPPVQAARAGL